MDCGIKARLTDQEIDKKFQDILDFSQNGPRIKFNDQGGWSIDPLEIIIELTNEDEGVKLHK